MAVEALQKEPRIAVEIAYATPDRQRIIPLQVKPGTTAWQAVLASGLGDEFPGLDVSCSPMGVFSQRLDGKRRPLPAQYVLQDHDRVEIYRPLTMDPQQARLARAAKNRSR